MTTEAKFKYALKEMILTRPLSEINVTLLCSKCGCHRQTFYYHYQDIYDLLAAIFLTEDIKGLKEAKTVEEALCDFLKYSKENFVFIKRAYNSAASDLVDDFYYGKMMARLFQIFVGQYTTLSKDAIRSLARRFSKIMADEFGYWLKIVSVTPTRFERNLKKFIGSSIKILLPALVDLAKEENKK